MKKEIKLKKGQKFEVIKSYGAFKAGEIVTYDRSEDFGQIEVEGGRFKFFANRGEEEILNYREKDGCPDEVKPLTKKPTRIKKEKPQKAAEDRIYYAVFTKLADDPEAVFITQYHAEKYCEHMKKINIHSKFTIQVIKGLSFKYYLKFCKSCEQEVSV